MSQKIEIGKAENLLVAKAMRQIMPYLVEKIGDPDKCAFALAGSIGLILASSADRDCMEDLSQYLAQVVLHYAISGSDTMAEFGFWATHPSGSEVH